jgi:drug/metabolite transporter (DMT)-like permease
MKLVVTRAIKTANFLTMTAILGGCGLLMLMSLPLFLLFEEHDLIAPKTMEDALLVSGLLLAFCSIACINLALKLENAGPVTLIRSCDVIFAFLLQFIFLGVVPDLLR